MHMHAIGDKVQLTLELDFILDDKGLALVIDLLGELGRDGMVSSRVLDNKTLLALHTLIFSRLLNCPLANVGPFLLFTLLRASCVLLGGGGLPTLLPALGELFKERGLKCGGLKGGGVVLAI